MQCLAILITDNTQNADLLRTSGGANLVFQLAVLPSACESALQVCSCVSTLYMYGVLFIYFML